MTRTREKAYKNMEKCLSTYMLPLDYYIPIPISNLV